MTDLIVQIRGLRHTYPDGTVVKVEGLDFFVHPGEKVFILGPNGAGKTTLLAHLMGLLKPEEGVVRILGLDPVKEFYRVRKELGVVFQNVDEQIIGPTVWDDVAFAPINSGYGPQEVKVMVDDILTTLGIEGLRDKVPHYLSGGQRRKVALAGAMVLKPKILILDEPFDGLDPQAKGEMVTLLKELNRRYNTALVITTHEVNLVPNLADAVYILRQGELVFRGTPAQAFVREDLLREARLEAPVLYQLFNRLAQQGMPVVPPQEVEGACRQLMQIWQKGVQGGWEVKKGLG